MSSRESSRMIKNTSEVPEGGEYDSQLSNTNLFRRVQYNTSWDFSVRGSGCVFDLAKQPYLTSLLANMRGRTMLNNPEIHVIWKGLVPPRNCSETIVVTCSFTPRLEEESSLMYRHEHPMYLYMHHIFYPEHSVRLGPGETLPWSIGFNLEESEFAPDYKLAQVKVFLRGYESIDPCFGESQGSKLISLVPIDEHVSGLRLSRPRSGQRQGWETGGFTLGLNTKSTSTKLLYLQKLGIDVEGLRLSKKLNTVLKSISLHSIASSNTPEQDIEILETIKKAAGIHNMSSKRSNLVYGKKMS
ncbi:hypothetical protein 3 [Monoclea gottschei varicosa-like virus]|uniref:Uncharacterized protein n=1 Tax=Monoclea gottschei varicosa-like virus TaxID=2933180 RepID=A0A9C7GWF7_9RHAB|nr:hypothetical protein 3 [Monoclea gottschei varicosa-like virus]CAI5383842.1 hypothetical protein 3 [Monoclea gottschei varicosa-like virus]